MNKLLQSIFVICIFCSILSLLIIVSFQQLGLTFYQQDEWLGSGQVMAFGYGVVLDGLTPLQLIFAEGRPFSRLLGAFIFKYFAFDIYPLALYSIGFQIINTIFVFLISLKLFRNYINAFVAASFFGLSSVTHQVVSWFAASFGSQPAVFFILLAIYFCQIYMEKKKILFLILSFFSSIVSLYFKEIGIFLFIFIPFMLFLFQNKVQFLEKIKTSAVFLGVTVLFVVYRIIDLLFLRTAHNSAHVFITSDSSNIVLTLVARSLLYPLTSFSLLFIPYNVANNLAYEYVKLYYPYIPQNISRWDLIAQTSILDNVSMFLSFIMIACLYLIFKKRKEMRKKVLFALVLFFLSIMPFIVISKSYAYMEPRYYHVPIIAIGIIAAIFFDSLVALFKRNRIALVVLIIIFIAYLRYHVGVIRTDIAVQVTIADERRAFLKQLNSALPTLRSNENIFFFTGNSEMYSKSNFVPFQHGFGYSVLTLYYDSNRIPKKFLEKQNLFNLGEQGFLRHNEYSFGYYSEIDDLKKAFDDNNFSVENIHAYYYDNVQKQLRDISEETREKVLAN